MTAEEKICDGIVTAWFGREYNPAGRLNVSFPQNVGSIPAYYSMLPGGAGNYYEGPKAARYPFGYGLSYTSFEYSDLSIVKRGQYDFDVTVKVNNAGERDGDEVVQLYIDDVESSVVTPPLLLKGFERVHIKAGEKKEVTFKLNKKSFEILDVKYRRIVEPGEFRILVGAASNDIRLTDAVYIS